VFFKKTSMWCFKKWIVKATQKCLNISFLCAFQSRAKNKLFSFNIFFEGFSSSSETCFFVHWKMHTLHYIHILLIDKNFNSWARERWIFMNTVNFQILITRQSLLASPLSLPHIYYIHRLRLLALLQKNLHRSDFGFTNSWIRAV